MLELAKLLVLLGAGSFALHFFGYEFKLLMWIDTWGEEIGHGIRAAILLSGLAIYAIAFKLATREEITEPSSPANTAA